MTFIRVVSEYGVNGVSWGEISKWETSHSNYRKIFSRLPWKENKKTEAIVEEGYEANITFSKIGRY